MRKFLIFLPLYIIFASIAMAANKGLPEQRTYSGYVERWKSVGTYRYALMNKRGEAIIYIGDDYPDDLGNDRKRDVRECLDEAVTLGEKVEIGGEWIKLPEGVEGFDEQTITCRILK